MRNLNDTFDFHGVRMNPGTLYVGKKHVWGAGHAETGVDAAFGFEPEVEFCTVGGFDAVDR